MWGTFGDHSDARWKCKVQNLKGHRVKHTCGVNTSHRRWVHARQVFNKVIRLELPGAIDIFNKFQDNLSSFCSDIINQTYESHCGIQEKSELTSQQRIRLLQTMFKQNFMLNQLTDQTVGLWEMTSSQFSSQNTQYANCSLITYNN